jgi:hypothetical protein
MQAAHPLVIAGARETGFYERNPWKRLQRTLILTYTITFGTKDEARAAADLINEVHARIKGIDEVTGLAYDALNPELLLYVHACLVDSALLEERRSAGLMTPDGSGSTRSRCSRPRWCSSPESIPRRCPGFGRTYARSRSRILRHRVGQGGRGPVPRPPREAEWRPVLKGVSRLAFFATSHRRFAGSTPTPWPGASGRDRRVRVDAALRPSLPSRFRYIAPYHEWRKRQKRPRPRARARRGV